MFVIIEFLNNQAWYFVRRDFSFSSLCTGFCVFSLEQIEPVELSKIPTPSVRATFESFKIPDNFSILGKTPLEFLKACYKERFNAIPKIKIQKEIRNYAKAKKKESSSHFEGGLFEDLGEDRRVSRAENPDNSTFDIF